MGLSLYVHIPFCQKRCVYCDFVSGIYDPEKSDQYLEALGKELLLIPNDTPLSTLFIGGGTPSTLPGKTLGYLLRIITNRFNLIDNYESTIEVNPGTLDREKLQVLRSSGINRISIGAQSFNGRELAFLGRIHSSDETEKAAVMVREAGFRNFGLDLIYGIPGQTLESWRNTLVRAVQLQPVHISAYELTVEQGTPLSKLNLDSNEDDVINMYEYAIDYLAGQGLMQYEISNFARPGYECRHNVNYWDRGEYFGAGLGAHSFIRGERFMNTDDLEEYIHLLSDNQRPVRKREHIPAEKAFSEAVFLGLRKTEGISVESFTLRYRINIVSEYRQEIEDLQSADLIRVSPSESGHETVIKLTRKGLLLSNEVFRKFL